MNSEDLGNREKESPEKGRAGKKESPRSLRKGMYRIMLYGWFFPVLLLFCAGIYVMSAHQVREARRSVVTSSENASRLVSMRVADCVRASREASYLPILSAAYRQYRTESSAASTGELYNVGNSFLSKMYKSNANLSCAILYFTMDPGTLCYTLGGNTYSSYSDIRYYKSHVHERVRKLSGTLDTGIRILTSGAHAYMVRNLMDSAYHPYAVLVFELNTDELFAGLSSIWGSKGCDVIGTDGQILASFGETYGPSASAETETGREEESRSWTETVPQDIRRQIAEDPGRAGSVFRRTGGECLVWKTAATDAGAMIFLTRLDTRVVYADVRTLGAILCLFPLFLFPILHLISGYLRRQVTEPVDAMVDGFRQIGRQQYGYHIGDDARSMEFRYLERSFNEMSDRLKQQFESIYLEQLKLRDARIMALQSQINPHFLNNTLEIINWEARLGENDKVSGMIEALSVMLSATMNRSRRRRVELKEELSYMDAYLYIIRERIGEDRFRFTEKIQENLRDAMVPQFIIQPLVENAVEHGMDPDFGRITLNIYSRPGGEKEDEVLVIDVTDNGRLSGEDMEKIRAILDEDIEDVIQKGGRTSLGIRNVNQRLKILYGDSCGLSIEPDGEGHTRSRMLLKLQHADNKCKKAAI